jgi:hypothetical protein
VFAELAYPLEGRPGTLALTPPMKGDTAYSVATIGFVLYHQGLAVNDFRYLAQEETVDLDWEDPWYSRFQNKNLWRQYNTPVNAFLYIEHFEVRVEIIVRPFDLQQWTDLGLADRHTIPVEMQTGLKQQVADFLAEHIELTVDAKSVTPALDRIHFLRRTLRTSAVVHPPEELDVVAATLGAIYTVPRSGLPQTASLAWDIYSPKMPRVRAAATDEAGPMPYYLQPDDRILQWRNFLKNPTLPELVELEPPPEARTVAVPLASLGCAILLLLVGLWARRERTKKRAAAVMAVVLVAGTVLLWSHVRVVVPVPLLGPPRVENEEAQEVLSGLLKNIYRAFDFREENVIYDTLARSASGDLLTRVYLETRRSLELQSQGGARVKVKKVDMEKVDSRPLGDGAGFAARATWTVTGTVGHWGHIHRRTNRYDAQFTVRVTDGAWRITGLELLLEQRVG